MWIFLMLNLWYIYIYIYRYIYIYQKFNIKKSTFCLLQSALQPLWVMACLTIVEYPQQEGFLQSAVASGTSNVQPWGPVIRTFQLPPPGVPHVWNDASEPQQLKVELWARNFREFCRKWRLPRHFWVLLHAVNLRHGVDDFTFLPKEGALRIFSPDGFGRVWTRELEYQRPGRLPLDHRSRSYIYIYTHTYIHTYILVYTYRIKWGAEILKIRNAHISSPHSLPVQTPSMLNATSKIICPCVLIRWSYTWTLSIFAL